MPVPPVDLIPVGERLVCPRCYALTTPATLVPSGPRPDAESSRGFDPAAAPVAASDAPASPQPVPRLDRLRHSIRQWAAGRSWWIRAPVLAWMAWILFRYWDAPWYSTLWKGIDLAIHEIGHILWSPLGEFMGFAGGTLTQLLIPVAAGYMLYRQRDWFGVTIAVCWLGINCFETVEYAADAVARRLPLVSPSTATPMHDWTYLLSRLGLLDQTAEVAAAWQWAGRLIMGAGVAFGAWVLWLMHGASTPPNDTDPANARPAVARSVAG